MSFYSKGGAFLVRKGSVQDSQIDMNFRKITSLADPTNDYDAVNKRTLDNAVPNPVNIQETELVTLFNTDHVFINTSLIGKYNISILPNIPPNVQGAPISYITLFKSKQSNKGKKKGFYQTSDTGDTRIRADWLASEQIRIFKTNNNYNGEYIVTISDIL